MSAAGRFGPVAAAAVGPAERSSRRGPGYYVHPRTTCTVFPGSFYGQELPGSTEWSTVLLHFEVDLWVDSISWYR